jgi:predicted negative regulator of RcsB-dependent stress response
MSTYLTEEEQIEQIKKWWREYGNLVTTVILIAALSIIGYRFWQNRELRLASQASTIYTALITSDAKSDQKGVLAAATSLQKMFKSTVYAQVAGLFLAKDDVEQGKLELAIKQLQGVVHNAKDPNLRSIARLRLARALTADKQHQSALDILAAAPPKAFLPLFAQMRGDIYSAMGQKDKARAAYQQAMVITRAGNAKKTVAPILQMKYDDIR